MDRRDRRRDIETMQAIIDDPDKLQRVKDHLSAIREQLAVEDEA